MHLTRGYARTLVVTDSDGTTREVSTTTDRLPPRRLGRTGIAVAAAVTFALAGVVSGFASANPDGLEFVAEELGFIDQAEDSAVASSPLGDYSVLGIDNPYLATGLAGVLGVSVVVLLGYAVSRLVAREDPAEPVDERRTESV